MTSRLSTKPSKKDRPKSSDKSKAGNRSKRDGTPEKPASPTQSQCLLEEEIIPPSKQVLDGEDIQALAIQPQELAKLRAPKPPQTSLGAGVNKRVTVRKLKPQSELDKLPTKTVLIAKPAPPNAPLKHPDYTGISGPRFDVNGNILPHSILGTIHDFQYEATAQGHIKVLAEELEPRPQTPSVKHQKKPQTPVKPRDSFLDENKALINWQQKMIERKKQQGYISKLLQKPVDTLVMHQADGFRQTQEERYLVDRSIPALDYGKGYRVGSEFWKQQERIGNDLSGIHMTLTQTERGYAPAIEHVKNPGIIKHEMGLPIGKGRTSPVYYPWHQSEYLKQRCDQLKSVMEDLDPFQPDMDALQVIGSNQPTYIKRQKSAISHKSDQIKTDTINDIKPGREQAPTQLVENKENMSGPLLLFHGFHAGWTGNSYSCRGELAHTARITFEAFAGERTMNHLHLVNQGTTSLYYEWKKIPKVNPFEVGSGKSKVQRFYFNTSSEVLLPGDSIKFPFIFKSPNAGIFSEVWQLETKPVVCGGAALQVTLRGIALQEDKNKKQRNELERELHHRQADMMMRRIIDDLVDGIRTPQRPASPVDAYITDEEQFQRQNPHLHFSHDVVEQLKDLRNETLGKNKDDEAEDELEPWDFSILNLKQEMLELEDEEKQEELLTRLNAAINSLSFQPQVPTQQQLHQIGYQLMVEAMDCLETEANNIRTSLGLSEKHQVFPETSDILAANDTLRGGPPKEKKSAMGNLNAESPADPKKKGKKEEKHEDKKDKKDGKKGKKDDKDRPKSKQDKARPGKSRETASPKPLKERRTPRGDSRNKKVPVRPYPPPSETGDPVLDAKYRNKLYIMVYSLLCDTVDKMTMLFEDARDEEIRQRESKM